MAQQFSQDEVVSVIRRALVDRTSEDATPTYNLEDLLEIAAQCGVTESQVRDALVIESMEADIANREREEELQLDRARRAKRRSWTNHLFTYGVVVTGLAVINSLTTSFPWSLIVAGFWAIGLIFHTRFALFPSKEALEDTALELRKEDHARKKRQSKLERKIASDAIPN